MVIEQKGIYLVNFNPSKGTEAGEIRPALVLQNDLLNQLNHASTMMIPLTTQLSSSTNVLRFCITARQNLKQDSDAMLDQIRTIDNRCFTSDLLARISDEKFQTLKQRFLRLI